MRKAITPAVLAAATFLFACSSGSGGGGTAVTGLTPPEQLAIVAPSGAGGASSSVAPSATDPGFPAGSQYYTDGQDVYVYDPAVEPLRLINEILCFLGKTGATELVNEGPYVAQIDVTECEAGENESSAGSSSGQSAASGADEIELWTIESERASNSVPHSVHLWIPEEEIPDSLIYVALSLEESASEADPFGRFSLNFALTDDYASIETPEFLGALGTIDSPTVGDIGFTFFENSGDIDLPQGPGEQSHRVQVSVEMNDAQTSGWAHILSSERYDWGGGDSGILTQEFDVAFDETTFLRSTDGGPGVAYDRGDYDENVWRYNLYYADGPNAGTRVVRNGGFGIETVDGVYGWAGYYGIWMPDGVTLAHGETVTTETYGEAQNEEVAYTVFKAPGRLVRNEKETLDLIDIEGQVFEWWTWDGMAGMSVIYLVQYFNGSGTWKKVATVDQNTYQSTALTPTETIDTAVEGVLHMWSDGLGGSVVFVDGETSITFYGREFVDGSDAVFSGSAVLSLQGFVQSLKSMITVGQAETGDIYLPDAPDVLTPHSFEFRQDDLTLWYDTDGMGTFDQVGLAPGQVPTQGPNLWGMSSGPLVTADVAATLTTIWDAWNADEFYVYETGHNPWNQFTGLKDQAGDFVEFEQPLTFTYEHATANDRNGDATYDGQTYYLQFEGSGNLHGLPHLGVDLNGDGNFDRYYPLFSLLDGTPLSDSAGTNYVVKATEIEQTLTEDPAYAGALTVTEAQGLPLPLLSSYATPAIGEKPVVTGAPRVINGVALE